MKLVRQFCILSLAMVSLSACFLTETSLIDEGEAVLPVDGDMVVCLSEEDPCIDLVRLDDGYFAQSPEDPDDTFKLRFAPLAQVAGKQVFLAEAELNQDEQTGYAYGLARRVSEPNARGATMDVAPLDCEDASEKLMAKFRANGGTVEAGKITSCAPQSLAQLKDTVLLMHQEDLADDVWWAAQAREF
ncbi:hypothetical protein WNY37_07690 [Henriciella sp. AS95]|uniref:hypothetical protein n=1 Tax=Henriciella sp. AS95 TaxID=3135782 RepID=UPI00317FB5E2